MIFAVPKKQKKNKRREVHRTREGGAMESREHANLHTHIMEYMYTLFYFYRSDLYPYLICFRLGFFSSSIILCTQNKTIILIIATIIMLDFVFVDYITDKVNNSAAFCIHDANRSELTYTPLPTKRFKN